MYNEIIQKEFGRLTSINIIYSCYGFDLQVIRIKKG